MVYSGITVSKNSILCVLALGIGGVFFATRAAYRGGSLASPGASGENGSGVENAANGPADQNQAHPEDVRHELEVDIPIASEFGDEAEVKRRYQLEDDIAAALGETGTVDGGDMGDGVMGIFVVDVSNPALAVERTKAALARHHLLDTATILYWKLASPDDEQGESFLVWPPTYEGVFARWLWPETTFCPESPLPAP